MKLDQLLFEMNLDYGEAPKRPKDAPPYYDELSIPHQRLWIKLNSFSFDKTPKAGSSFKIKNYYSKGASSSSFYNKGTVSKDDFINDKYEFKGWVTETVLKYSYVWSTGRSENFIWSKEKGSVPCRDLETASYAERIGSHPTKFVLADGLNINSFAGMPDKLDSCNISRNPITSLDEFPSQCKVITAIDCKIKSIKDIDKKISYCEKLYLAGNPIEGGVLSLLKINGLKEISLGDVLDRRGSDLRAVAHIIQKHLRSDRDIMDCQDELIDAGFESYAKL